MEAESSVLVPLVAKRLGFDYKKADYADVISSIGVATGMIYEEKERTINNPTPEDVNKLITEIKEEAIRKNASPDSLSVQSEYISDRSILRVTAIGNVTLDLNSNGSKELNQDELLEIAKDLFQLVGNISLEYSLGSYRIFTNSYRQRKLFFNANKRSILVLDKFGRVRLSLDNGKIISSSSSQLSKDLPINNIQIFKFGPFPKCSFVRWISVTGFF